MSKNKTGVLLINLGTPDTPTTSSIRQFLKQFLMDHYVIQLPWVIRAIVVYGLILPFRPKKLVPAYQAIWTKKGSPLLTISQQVKAQLQEKLGDHYQVELAMRYTSTKNSEVSIIQALDKLQATCHKIIIMPQFPQYAESTTRSAYQMILNYFKTQINLPELIMIRDFYDLPIFIEAQANLVNKTIQPDYYLFSFHGLPESHVKKAERNKRTCDLRGPCPSMGVNNLYCYRAQCYETARLLAKALNLSVSDYGVSFQSRLGRTPWIQPYTDEFLLQLRNKGIKNLVVVCPSFTVDCLETLEEMHIRARKQWHDLGGERFSLTPCVNSNEAWIAGLRDFLTIH